MKLQSLIAAASLLLTASMSSAQASKLSTQYPSFFKPGHVTSLSVKDESQLPHDYLSFSRLVEALISSNSETAEPQEDPTYASRTDYVCAKAPGSRECAQAQYSDSHDGSSEWKKAVQESRDDDDCAKHPSTRACAHKDFFEARDGSTEWKRAVEESRTNDICARNPYSTRACVHARYFEEMRKPQKKAPPFIQLSISGGQVWEPGNYTNMYIHLDFSAEFSPDFDRNTEIATAMINKIKNSTHRLAFVFVPTTNRVVKSSNVRVVDDDCHFVGTPEQYLKTISCW